METNLPKDFKAKIDALVKLYGERVRETGWSNSLTGVVGHYKKGIEDVYLLGLQYLDLAMDCQDKDKENERLREGLTGIRKEFKELRKYARDQFSVGITESIVKQIDSLLTETKPE